MIIMIIPIIWIQTDSNNGGDQGSVAVVPFVVIRVDGDVDLLVLV